MTTQYRNRDLRKLAVLWSAVDAGQVTLPSDVDALRSAHRRLSEQAQTITAPPGPGTPAALADVVMTAALAGADLPDIATVAEAFARRTAAEALGASVRAAIETLEDRLVGLVYGSAEELVVDHLQPVFAVLLADLHRAAAALVGHDIDPATLLSAPAEVREARVELDHVVNRYASLRAIYDTLTPALAITLDVDGRFSEMSNAADIWPQSNAIGHNVPPWPTDDPVGRLLWLESTSG